MGGGKRVDRIDHLLRAEIGQIIQRELKDPRIHAVTIQDVSCSADLGSARVFVSVFDDSHSVEDAVAGLRSAAGFVRRLLRERLDFKKIPELRFEVDQTLIRARHIEKLLADVQDDVSREVAPADSADPADSE